MIIVMGLPGAGKSAVLTSMRHKRKDYKIVNYGDLMFEIEKQKGWVNNRDEMRKLSIEKQKIVQGLVAKELAKDKGKLLLDTHCSISTPSGYYPGLPFGFLKKLKVEKLIYITALPVDIVQRRKTDDSRVRDAETLEKITEHDDINKSYLAAYSAFTGSPALIIMNSQGKLEETVVSLEAVLL